ncbi:MAG: formate dehydrogenase subunit alpha, partial [Desulfobulbaceae bacterium]|nr:formate dehydrogenase subunit alpha [Desulfobulbaceae bacterium]
MITGRGSYHHYHTGTMTRRSPSLNRELDKSLLAINPKDAQELGVRNGDKIQISSRRGSCCFFVSITESMRQGELFSNFHFHEAPVNALTVIDSDPKARIPEFKICAVKAEKVSL